MSSDVDIADWTRKAAFMRACGATSAEWTTSGELTSLVLGTAPPSDDSDLTQRRHPTSEERRREMDNVRRITTASSGGPVKRPDGD